MLLVLPGLLAILGIPVARPLRGAYVAPEKPVWTLRSWFNSSYQEQADDYLAWQLTIKAPLVRIRNQFLYSALDRPAPRFVVKGKQEYLYEDAYIKATYGMDYRGAVVWDSIVNSLNTSAEALRAMNIPLIVVLAPGKASFFPEYIPDRYEPYRKDSTNYEALRGRLINGSVKLVDLHAWFRYLKEKEGKGNVYPLFPKTGTHWSTYGMHLAADSITRFLAQTLDTVLPRWEYLPTGSTRELQDQDRDIEESLNLLWPIPNIPMQYPELKIRDSGSYRPRGAIIADSYFWNMFNKGFCSQLMDSGEFWYYADQVYPQSFESPLQLSVEHIRNSLKRSDFLILLSTDGTLDRFPWGADAKLLEATSGI